MKPTDFNIGDKVKILTDFAKLILHTDKGIVTAIKEKTVIVQLDNVETKLAYKPDEIEKI